MLLELGIDNKTASEMLGPSEVVLKTTYQHSSKKMQKKSADKISTVIQKLN